MTRIPRAIAGRDIRKLPLRPAEAFLLSRIDAATDEGDLSLLTGLSVAEVEAALNRLFDLGAIDFVRGERGAAQPEASATSPSAPPAAPKPAAPERQRYDPAELDEDVELDRERRQRVLDVFYRLSELSHYELLRVDRTAEKKQIKNAYYELAPEFHTDTYFGKRLGSYKAKIEAIFSRITQAHDVLTHRDRRAEYDGQLGPIPIAPATPAPVSAPASAPVSAPASKPIAVPASVTVTVSAPASDSSRPPGRSTERPEAETASERSRREALAKKLSGGYRRVSSPGISVGEADQRRAQLERAERSLRQGHYEAGEGRWAEAAVSFEDACRVLTTNAGAHERAAFAALKRGGRPEKAIELARRAVDLAPSAPEYRLTLARAYFAEGMEKRARAELDQAAVIGRGDPTIKRCIEEIVEHALRRGKLG